MLLFLARFCSHLLDGLGGDHSVRTDEEAMASFLCLLARSCVCKGLPKGCLIFLSVKAPVHLFLFAVDVCKVCDESVPRICSQQQTASGMHCNTWSVEVLNVSECPASLIRGNSCVVSDPDFSCPMISKWLTFSSATCQITTVLGDIGRTM